MALFETILPLLLTAITGGAIAWAYFRLRITSEIQKASSDLELENRVLEERLSAKEVMLAKSRSFCAELENKLTTFVEQSNALARELSACEEKIKNWEERQKLSDALELRFRDTFKALSSEALQSSNQTFLELARATLEKFQESAKGELDSRKKEIDGMVKPLHESLAKVDVQIQSIEKERNSSFATLSEQLKQLASSQTALRDETQNLVKALRKPNVRGRWGEIQLQRVVEMAGMLEYCDFVQQESSSGEDGRLRPDMIIRLPSNKNIVLDSKAPLMAYLDAIEAPQEEQRVAFLNDHARHIRKHIYSLSQRSYWEQFEPTPEFVVLFLPGETFFSAALEQDPSLIELGAAQRVIVATPTTLIALLRAVAYGWRQEQLAVNAQQISDLGKALYQRLESMIEHYRGVKRGLDTAIENYNRSVGAFEARVMPSLRKFRELGVGGDKEIETLQAVEKSSRTLSLIEEEPSKSLVNPLSTEIEVEQYSSRE